MESARALAFMAGRGTVAGVRGVAVAGTAEAGRSQVSDLIYSFNDLHIIVIVFGNNKNPITTVSILRNVEFDVDNHSVHSCLC